MSELFLVPSPIGNLKEVSPRVIEVLNSVDYVACEDTRNTSKLLNLLGLNKRCVSCHEHNENMESDKIISSLLEGKNVAYLSDAGYPCISDPGSILVKKAIENNIKVTPLSGPNAFLNALVGSGIDSSHFLFYGFLDSKESKRESELEKLKYLPYTLIFYEAPHRINDTLKSMEKILGNRKITVARELTKLHEEFIRTDLTSLNRGNSTFIGELVIIVDKYNEVEKTDFDDYLPKLELLLKAGYKLKDATSIISLLFNVNKNKLYKRVIKKDWRLINLFNLFI